MRGYLDLLIQVLEFCEKYLPSHSKDLLFHSYELPHKVFLALEPHSF
jgi:hypothetical protein